jgi:RNA recognition motif-containing protein
MAKRLYVGNLAYAVTENDLNKLFSQAGKVESAAVVMDRLSGRSKGFGFVEMADPKDAASAIQSFDGTEFMGRNIKVSEAKAREPNRDGNRGGNRGERASRW